MAFFDDGNSNRASATAGSSRPTSARGKTTKEIELEKAIKMVRGRVTERDKRIKTLETEKRELSRRIEQLEAQNRKASKTYEKERRLRTGAVSEKQEMKAILQKTQRAIAARMQLLGIDFGKCNSISEALDAALSAINKLIAQLEEKEALLKQIEDENTFLKNKIEQYENELNTLKKQLKTSNDTVNNQNIIIDEQKEKIINLENENTNLKQENENLINQVADLKNQLDQTKDDNGKRFDEMAAKILELQEDNNKKSTEIEDLNKIIEELRAKVSTQENQIKLQDSELEELRKLLAEREITIAKQENEIEDLRSKVKELEDEIYRLTHIPTDDKCVQTEISGDIGEKLSDYPRLLKEIVALRNLLGQKNDFITKLEDENRELLSEFDELMKKIVRFYPCTTNHKLEVLSMEASPSKYIVATGSSDLSCRLWKVDPDAKKANQRMKVYQRSMVEGKVDCLSWNYDGTLLAAGSGYKDSPDGYVVIWALDGPDKYNSIYAIRSRPTVRFGRVKSISFSTRNNQFIYCGDTTGQIWVFDLIKESLSAGSGLIGVIQTQRDVINDMSLSGDGRFLYSVSFDQTLAVFELPQEFGGSKSQNTLPVLDSNNASGTSSNGSNTPRRKKSTGAKRKSKNKVSTPTSTSGNKALSLATQTSNASNRSSRNSSRNLKLDRDNSRGRSRDRTKSKTKSDTIKYSLSELLADESMPTIKHCKGVIIANDGKYPFWKVCMSRNGQTVICASRKVRIFNINGNPTQNPTENVIDGPKVNDADLDHVRSLKYRNGNLLLCRTLVPRAKLVDVQTGKEIRKFSCKSPVQAVEFLADNAYIVICTQEYTAESCDPPLMKLVKYSDNRINIEKEDEKYVVPDTDNAVEMAADMEDNAVSSPTINSDETVSTTTTTTNNTKKKGKTSVSTGVGTDDTEDAGTQTTDTGTPDAGDDEEKTDQ